MAKTSEKERGEKKKDDLEIIAEFQQVKHIDATDIRMQPWLLTEENNMKRFEDSEEEKLHL